MCNSVGVVQRKVRIGGKVFRGWADRPVVWRWRLGNFNFTPWPKAFFQRGWELLSPKQHDLAKVEVQLFTVVSSVVIPIS